MQGRLATNDALAAVSDFFFLFGCSSLDGPSISKRKKINCSIISSSVFYPLIQIWFMVAMVFVYCRAKGLNGSGGKPQ